MTAAAKLPRSVEELAPEWLESALSTRCPGIKVAATTIDKVIWGTATKVLMDVHMREPLKLDYLWAGLCILGAVYFIFRSP